MTDNFLLYTLPSDDMETMKAELERVLDVQLDFIDSDDWGPHYSTPTDPHEDIVSIYKNWDHQDDMVLMSKYAGSPLLVSIYDTEDQDNYHERIMRSKELEAVLVKRTEKYEKPIYD